MKNFWLSKKFKFRKNPNWQKYNQATLYFWEANMEDDGSADILYYLLQ